MWTRSKNNYLGAGVFALCLIIIISFRPIIHPRPNNCYVISGEVEQIWSSDETRDINIRIAGNDKVFYINRGLDSELRTFKLKTLIGEHIDIYAVKHWTILDPKSKIQHIACVVNGRDTLYTEF